MNNFCYEIQPKNIYKVFKSRPLTEEGKNSLIFLYQPIIGSDSLATYFAMLGDEGTKNEYAHIDILDTLNIGLNKFLTARKFLEGLGLLSVYRKKDEECGFIYQYILQEPVHPENFFSDDTYTFLLINAIGDRKFKQLLERFKPKKIDLSCYQDITSKFTQIYRFHTELYEQKQQELSTISKNFKINSAKLKFEDKLDWEFLISIAKKKHIEESNFTDALKKKLLLYNKLYGFMELELLEFLTQATCISTGYIDQKELEKQILLSRKKHKRTIYSHKDISTKQRLDILRQKGYSENDLQLIHMSETVPPMKFLEAIKYEKSSFVTKEEEYLLMDLIKRSSLCNSIINVLIHYILVVQNNSLIRPNLINKIATNWSELKLNEPEEAIEYVRKLVKGAKKKAINSRKSSLYNFFPNSLKKQTKERENLESVKKVDKLLKEFLNKKEKSNAEYKTEIR